MLIIFNNLYSSKHKSLFFSFICLNLPTFFGFKPPIPIGHYEGSLSRKSASQTIHQDIKIDVKELKSRALQIEVKNNLGEVIDSANISWPNSWFFSIRKLQLTIPRLESKPIRLEKVHHKKNLKLLECYFGETQYIVDACFSHERFFIRITSKTNNQSIYNLTGELHKKSSSLDFEIPQNFNLKQAILIAMKKNFDTQIEYQRLQQAIENAKASILNLFPHFNYRSAVLLNIPIPLSLSTPLSLASFAGDFVPFLLPTRWFKVKELEDESKAEAITYDLLRADLANQIHSIAYRLEELKSNYIFYHQLIATLSTALERVVVFGKLPEIAVRLKVYINLARLELAKFDADIKTTKNSIALALGFHNPEVIKDLNIDEDIPSPEDTSFLNKYEISQLALQRALELKQIDFLIDEAHYQKRELYFNWMDPEVDSRHSLGLGLIEYIKLSKSIIHSLIIKREQTQTTICEKCYVFSTLFNNAITNYLIAMENLITVKNFSQDFFNRLNNLEKLSDYSGIQSDLQFVIQNYISLQLRINNITADFKIYKAQIDRLLLRNFYEEILPNESFDKGNIDDPLLHLLN